MRRWNLVVQKERLCAERTGTVCHLNGFVTTRMTVVTAQTRRVSRYPVCGGYRSRLLSLLKLQHLAPRAAS